MPVRTNQDGEPVPEAHMGNLTPEQSRKLRQFYLNIFRLSQQNLDVSDALRRRGGPAAVPKEDRPTPTAPDKPPKHTAADDGAHDDAKNQEEQREMQHFLRTYGGDYLRTALYDFVLADYIDASALRFLRARKWDVDRATAMLCAALGFRLDNDLTGLVAEGENGLKDVPGFLNQFRRGISYVHGNTADPGEHPVFFIHVSRHFTNAQKIETLQRFILLVMEATRLLCTPPMEKAVIVFDLSSFGLKNMDWGCVIFLVRCLEAYYPESLHRIYVHGAPWLFRGVWQVLSPMLDPVVRDKIKFTTKPRDLAEFVPASKLRVAMGGTMDWEWEYTEPEADENDLLQRTDIADRIRAERDELWARFEQVTRGWCLAESDDAVPDLTFQRLVLQKQIRLKQLQLNPYVRGINVYQRQGVLTEANSHTWTYAQSDGSTLSQTIGNRHDIPALFQWLIDHNQDVFPDSYGTRFGACGIARTPDLIPSWVAKHGGPVLVPALAHLTPTGTAIAAPQSAARPPPGLSELAQSASRSTSARADTGERVKRRSSIPPASAGAETAVYSHTGGGRSSGTLSSRSGNTGFATPPEYGYGELAEYGESGAAVSAPRLREGDGAHSDRVAGASRGAYYAAESRDGSGSAVGLGWGADGFDETRADSIPAHSAFHGQEMNNSFATEELSYDGADGMSEESDPPETSVRPDYIPAKPLKAAQVQLTDEECRADLKDIHKAMNLFLDSRMLESEELCVVNAGTRLYKAAGMGLINFVKSFMTFEQSDINTAIHCCKHTRAVASLLRKKKGPVGKWIQNRRSFYRSMTLVQLHAELNFAENTLMVCLLRMAKARGGIRVVKHALALRSAYLIMQDLFHLIEDTDARTEHEAITGKKPGRSHHKTPFLDQHFRSGVYFSYAACSLVLSFLPGRAHKVLDGLGYSGDRLFALQVLQRAGGWSKNKALPVIPAAEEGVRRPLCDIVLIVYHVVFPSFLPVLVDLRFADKVLQWNLQRYPHGIFFLYFQARLYAAQALPEKAIEYFRNSIEAQRSFKQLDHISFFDLSLTYLSTCDFGRAYECYDVLSRESNWSRAIYQYARAICLFESGQGSDEDSTTTMRTVAGLKRKLVGVTIPLEQFVTERARTFVAQRRLPLPGIEFSYLWHCIDQTPVFLLIDNTLTRIDDFIDKLEAYASDATADLGAYGSGSGEHEYWASYCLAFFLRGVALRYVAFPDEGTIVRAPPAESFGSTTEVAQDAMLSFHKVIQQGGHLDRTNTWLIYFAHYELGRLLECMGHRDRARDEFDLVLSERPLEHIGQAYRHGPSTPLSGTQHARPHAPLPVPRPHRTTAGHAHYLLKHMCLLRTQAALDTMRVRQARTKPAALLAVPPAQPQRPQSTSALTLPLSANGSGTGSAASYSYSYSYSYSNGQTRSYDQASLDAPSSFFAAAAPGTTLSEVLAASSSSNSAAAAAAANTASQSHYLYAPGPGTRPAALSSSPRSSHASRSPSSRPRPMRSTASVRT